MVKKNPNSLEWSSQVFPSGSQDGSDRFVLHFLVCLLFPSRDQAAFTNFQQWGALCSLYGSISCLHRAILHLLLLAQPEHFIPKPSSAVSARL